MCLFYNNLITKVKIKNTELSPFNLQSRIQSDDTKFFLWKRRNQKFVHKWFKNVKYYKYKKNTRFKKLPKTRRRYHYRKAIKGLQFFKHMIYYCKPKFFRLLVFKRFRIFNKIFLSSSKSKININTLTIYKPEYLLKKRLKGYLNHLNRYSTILSMKKIYLDPILQNSLYYGEKLDEQEKLDKFQFERKKQLIKEEKIEEKLKIARYIEDLEKSFGLSDLERKLLASDSEKDSDQDQDETLLEDENTVQVNKLVKIISNETQERLKIEFINNCLDLKPKKLKLIFIKLLEKSKKKVAARRKSRKNKSKLFQNSISLKKKKILVNELNAAYRQVKKRTKSKQLFLLKKRKQNLFKHIKRDVESFICNLNPIYFKKKFFIRPKKYYIKTRIDKRNLRQIKRLSLRGQRGYKRKSFVQFLRRRRKIKRILRKKLRLKFLLEQKKNFLKKKTKKKKIKAFVSFTNSRIMFFHKYNRWIIRITTTLKRVKRYVKMFFRSWKDTYFKSLSIIYYWYSFYSLRIGHTGNKKILCHKDFFISISVPFSRVSYYIYFLKFFLPVIFFVLAKMSSLAKPEKESAYTKYLRLTPLEKLQYTFDIFDKKKKKSKNTSKVLVHMVKKSIKTQKYIKDPMNFFWENFFLKTKKVKEVKKEKKEKKKVITKRLMKIITRARIYCNKIKILKKLNPNGISFYSNFIATNKKGRLVTEGRPREIIIKDICKELNMDFKNYLNKNKKFRESNNIEKKMDKSKLIFDSLVNSLVGDVYLINFKKKQWIASFFSKINQISFFNKKVFNNI